jgi:glycerol-3-phosphate O-acyltransferase
VLRPFLESYRIVADRLEQCDPEAELDPGRLVSECAGLGRQYHLQRRIRSTASISRVLLKTALRLADHRGVLAPGSDAGARRAALAEEIRAALRRVDAIDALAASRRAGLLD